MRRRINYHDLFGSLPEDHVYRRVRPDEEMLQSFSRQVTHLLSQLKKVSFEFVGLAAVSFALAILLAANSGELNGYRAYFLSVGRDLAVVLILSLASYRFLRNR